MANGSRCSQAYLALRMAESLGVDLIEVQPAPDGDALVVLGFGSGITMAACDHLAREYPYLGIIAGDLAGSLGVERRAMVMDYLGTAFPSLWLMWCGLIPATEYVGWLRARDFHPYATWAYVRGLGAERADEFSALGIRLLDTLWKPEPLGDWNALCEIFRRGCEKTG